MNSDGNTNFFFEHPERSREISGFSLMAHAVSLRTAIGQPPISRTYHSKTKNMQKTYLPLPMCIRIGNSCKVKRITAETDMIVEWHSVTPLARGAINTNDNCWHFLH